MRALLVFGIVVALGLGLAERGRACTRPAPLTPLEPRAVVADADAIFTGTLVAVRPKNPGSPGSPAPSVFTFAVDEWIRGDLGDRVEAVGWVGGCADFDRTLGRRGSFLLTRNNDEWGVGEVAPETVRLGLRPWPQPDGSGRAAFIAGGQFGTLRTALLDARGRTLAYGYGRGAVTALSVCPGRTRVAELIRSGESVRLALRELPSLRLLRETELRPFGFGEKLVCRSSDGADILAGVAVHGRPRSETQLIRSTRVGARIVVAAPSLSFAIRGTRVYVSLSDGRLVTRDLASGARRLVRRVDVSFRDLSVSPDEKVVAGFTGEMLVAIDLARGQTAQMPWPGFLNQTRWIGRRTLAAWSRGSDIQLFDEGLRPLRMPWSWKAHTTTFVGTGVFGVDWAGRFLAERNGRVVSLGMAFSPAISVLEPL
jgi:hypothetical protein